MKKVKENISPKKSTNNKKRKFGILKGKIKMLSNFDKPLDDFKDYM
jgi:uncharacterized protein DUF2281